MLYVDTNPGHWLALNERAEAGRRGLLVVSMSMLRFLGVKALALYRRGP